MLYSERRRLETIRAREAAGESLWTETVPRAALVKIAQMWEALANTGYRLDEEISGRMEISFRNSGIREFARTPERFESLTETEDILNHVEAVHGALDALHVRPDIFEEAVNDAFNEHRIAFRMVEGQVIPLSSDELHVEVVEPTLRLLIDGRFGRAHDAYLAALKEISRSDPADAITDAGTALQEALMALGCNGNALGPLIKSARTNGLLAPHDQNLADGIQKFCDWASADRSQTGDPHTVSDATLSDAWLMVHIVGALILRLADETPRA